MDSLLNSDILLAREQRFQFRQELAQRFRCAVLTLGMNIPGADKNMPGVMPAFVLLKRVLSGAVKRKIVGESSIFYENTIISADGPFWHIALGVDAYSLKAIAIEVEEQHFLGRLADIDVLDFEKGVLSRLDIGKPARKCFLCNEEATLCRRMGRHSIDDIMLYVNGLLQSVE